MNILLNILLVVIIVLFILASIHSILPEQVRKWLDFKQFEHAITLLGVAIAVYAIIQVNESDEKQDAKDKLDSLYKAKQFTLDSLQNEYIAKSKDILISIDTSSKSLSTNFSNISKTTQNVPHQIDKVNELLNSLSRVTREHKELIENQMKQRARLRLESKGIGNIGEYYLTVFNRGEKIAYMTDIEIEVKSGLVDEILVSEFFRQEYSLMSERGKGRFHFDFYREIPVTSDHHVGFTPKFKGEFSIDFIANIKIFYKWDGDEKGDVLETPLLP